MNNILEVVRRIAVTGPGCRPSSPRRKRARVPLASHAHLPFGSEADTLSSHVLDVSTSARNRAGLKSSRSRGNDVNLRFLPIPCLVCEWEDPLSSCSDILNRLMPT